MPPRRSAKPAQEDNELRNRRNSESLTGEKTSFWQSAKDFIADERTRYIAGLILLGIGVYLGFACISFFFTGAEDYSYIHTAQNLTEQSQEVKYQYQNWTGSLGARIANALMDGGFGVAIFFALYALFILGLRLMRAPVAGVVKTIGHSSFWMIWSSVAIGFVFRNYYMNNSFFRWGGKHGLVVSDWLVSYIQYTGTVILLLSALIIYLIIVDPNTVPRIKAFGKWLQQLFTRKPKEAPVTVQPVTIDTPTETEPLENAENAENNGDETKDINDLNDIDIQDEDSITDDDTDTPTDNDSEFVITNHEDGAETENTTSDEN